MLKRIKCLALALIIAAVTIPNNAFAADTSECTPEDILQKLNQKYDCVQVDLRPDLSSNGTRALNQDFTIIVKSWDELEALMDAAAVSVANKNKTIDIPLYENGTVHHQTRGTTYNGSDTITWKDTAWWQYALLTWEVFIWNNVKIDHTYQKNANGQNEFTNVRDISSWISGTTIARSWSQQGEGTWNIRNRNRANDEIWVSVTGTYTLGISVETEGVVFPIGLTTTDTWTCTLYWA